MYVKYTYLDLFVVCISKIVNIQSAEVDLGGVQGLDPPPFIPNKYKTTGYPEINYKLFMLCIIVTQYRIV